MGVQGIGRTEEGLVALGILSATTNLVRLVAIDREVRELEAVDVHLRVTLCGSKKNG